jgi:hypothetical protein
MNNDSNIVMHDRSGIERIAFIETESSPTAPAHAID